MAGSKKQQKTEEVYTPVISVVSCADETQVDRIVELCRIPRALTYNKLGSLKGWGLNSQKAEPIVRTILKATDINLLSKLWECSISDTMKAMRIVRTDRNRYRLRSYIKDLDDPIKVKNLLEKNPGHKVKSRKLQRDRVTIQNFIRRDLNKIIPSPTRIFAEDLTPPITGKQQSKAIYRQLNQWMKGKCPALWEKISRETGSTLSVVNPAYTWQMCSQTGPLLGKRDGDVFIAYTEVVIQSDKNAALNILYRGSDSEINPWMKYAEVRKVLLLPTVRYLTSIGKSVTEAWDLGWINPKFKAEVLRLEDEYHRQG